MSVLDNHDDTVEGVDDDKDDDESVLSRPARERSPAPITMSVHSQAWQTQSKECDEEKGKVDDRKRHNRSATTTANVFEDLGRVRILGRCFSCC